MCILDELYYEWHSPRERSQADIREAWGRSEDLWLKAEKHLDPALFEALRRSVGDLIDLESCREFREGFRLGARLMLEIPPSRLTGL